MTLTEKTANIARDASPHDGSLAAVPLLALLIAGVERAAVALEKLAETARTPTGGPKLTGRLRVLRHRADTGNVVTLWSGPIIESGEGWLKAEG